MIEYFKRQIELWGKEVQASLQERSVAIIGAGGLGSSLALAIGSCGIGRIEIVDFDEVEIHNIHRQISFRLDDVSKSKSVVNAKLIEQRSKYTKVIAHVCGFDEWVKKGIEVDLILDATDNLDVRAEIDRYAKEHKIGWVYGSVELFNAQVCLFQDSSFNDIFKLSESKNKGIAAPMVMNTASLQANLALRYLAGLSVKSDTLYYLYFDENGEFIVQKFKLPKASQQ